MLLNTHNAQDSPTPNSPTTKSDLAPNAGTAEAETLPDTRGMSTLHASARLCTRSAGRTRPDEVQTQARLIWF